MKFSATRSQIYDAQNNPHAKWVVTHDSRDDDSSPRPRRKDRRTARRGRQRRVAGHRPPRRRLHANPPGLRIHRRRTGRLRNITIRQSTVTSCLTILFDRQRTAARLSLTEAARSRASAEAELDAAFTDRRRKGRTRSEPARESARRGVAEETRTRSTPNRRPCCDRSRPRIHHRTGRHRADAERPQEATTERLQRAHLARKPSTRTSSGATTPFLKRAERTAKEQLESLQRRSRIGEEQVRLLPVGRS